MPWTNTASNLGKKFVFIIMHFSVVPFCWAISNGNHVNLNFFAGQGNPKYQTFTPVSILLRSTLHSHVDRGRLWIQWKLVAFSQFPETGGEDHTLIIQPFKLISESLSTQWPPTSQCILCISCMVLTWKHCQDIIFTLLEAHPLVLWGIVNIQWYETYGAFNLGA